VKLHFFTNKYENPFIIFILCKVGLFWTIIICRGFRIVRIVDILPTIQKEWIIRDTTGITFACPSMTNKLNGMSPSVDNDDVSQGFIIMDELIKCTDLSTKHFEVSDDDQKYQEAMPANEKINEIQ
jgi:hypothetical protein